MSQADINIGANQSGLAYRTADNNGKKALLNHHKGATEPSYKEAGMIWLDDTATPWILKIYDGGAFISLGEINATADTFVPKVGATVAAGIALSNTFTVGQIIDGAADEIQLRVQGHTAQTSNILVVEQSNGADLLSVANGGTMTVNGDAFIDSFNDRVALKVQGHSTQTNDLMILEKSDGTDVLNVDNNGNMTAAGSLKATGTRTNSVSIADDAVHSFTPPFTSGFILVHTSNGDGTKRIMAQYSTSGVAVMDPISIGSAYNAATGALTGTTGTDTKITVSAHTDGKIYIENRSGAAAAFNLTILG